ncbi:MAG: oligosaccharide flippase family protein [Ruminococcus flavefaciens]|nr:oligosaccharide flippase family protein [Ruminococcus flavefaciens]
MNVYMNINKFKEKYGSIPISARAAFWFMVCNIIQKGISVITTPIFTRMLTTEQYGEYTTFQSWMSIFTLICTFRLNYSVFTKGMSKYPNERDNFTVSIQSTMTIITSIILSGYLLLHQSIDSLTDMSMLITLAMFVEIYFSSSIQIWSLRNRYEFKYRVIIGPTIGLALLTPLLGIFAVYFSEDKGTARILSSVAAQVIVGAVFYIVNIKNSSKLFTVEHAKFAVTFNLPLIPHYLSTYVLDQADRVMIQKMCGYSDAAIYGVAYNAGTLMKIITDAINNAIVPWIYQKLETREYKRIEKYTISVLTMIMLVCVMLISFAPEMIYILGGKEYAKAVQVVPPVAASMFFTFLFSVVSNIEFYYDENKFTMYISMVGAALNIVLNHIFINLYGFVAAGYTTLACYVFFGVFHFVFMTHIVRKKENVVVFRVKPILTLSILMIAVAIGMSFLYRYVIIRYIFIVALAIILYMKRNILVEIMKK